MKQPIKWKSLFEISLVIILIAAGQTFAKLGADSLHDQGNIFQFHWGHIFILSSYLMILARSIIWMKIIRDIPLSVAYPFLALSFIIIMIISSVFFMETVTQNKLIGAGFIILGIIIIGIKNGV